MTFDPNKYKGQIEQLVKEKTGRTLALQGNLEVAVWPALGAKVAGVTLSERDGKEQFVALDSAHVSVAVLPLLHGEAIVDKIRLSGLKARIVKEKDGTLQFQRPAGAEAGRARGQAGGKAPKKEEPKAEKQSVGFDIAGVEIDRSAITYIDRQSGRRDRAEQCKALHRPHRGKGQRQARTQGGREGQEPGHGREDRGERGLRLRFEGEVLRHFEARRQGDRRRRGHHEPEPRCEGRRRCQSGQERVPRERLCARREGREGEAEPRGAHRGARAGRRRRQGEGRGDHRRCSR